MSLPIDYFFTPQSPWAYLGHARFVDLLRASRRAVRVLAVDYGRIFPLSGGLPLGQRAPQRQAYRLAELRRFAAHLNITLHPEPRHFPVDGGPAARLITTVAHADGPDAALRLTGAVMAACWAEQRDIASAGTLAELLDECDLPATHLAAAQAPEVQARYEAHTHAAIDAGVFGAPTYVIDGELFWGQDRLDFVRRAWGV